MVIIDVSRNKNISKETTLSQSKKKKKHLEIW